MLKWTLVGLLVLACGIELAHINYHERCLTSTTSPLH